MPEVGDGRPAGCKPAALAQPQSDSGLWLVSLLPVRDVPLPLRRAGAWFDSRRKRQSFPLSRRPEPSSSLGALDRPSGHIGYANRHSHMKIVALAV